MRIHRLIAAAACVWLCLVCFSGRAQESLSSRKPLLKVEAVEYLFPEQVTLPVGKPSAIALHFRIKQDLHINSHKPHDQYLIPTEFSIPESSGVRLAGAVYPDGSDFTLPADPSQKLSVYTGEFTIQTKMVATAGDHLVEAKLRYQACDQNVCMPPKTITVPIDVLGK
jgi:Disulphide bond corrector protein DsbC